MNTGPFSKGGSIEWLCTKISMDLYGLIIPFFLSFGICVQVILCVLLMSLLLLYPKNPTLKYSKAFVLLFWDSKIHHRLQCAINISPSCACSVKQGPKRCLLSFSSIFVLVDGTCS
jgi:hypothetical protein